MPFRTEATAKLMVDGRPHTLMLVDNPTIDDVLVIEMRLRAAEIMNETTDQERRVPRGVRDLLIQIGVAR